MQVDHINKNTIRVRIDKEELARRGLKVLDLLGDKDKKIAMLEEGEGEGEKEI